jgi:hypothetical protein
VSGVRRSSRVHTIWAILLRGHLSRFEEETVEELFET